MKQRINSACNSDKVQCFSEGEKEIYASRLIPPIKDIISAIDKVLLQLCGGDRRQILNSYDELLLNCGKLIETMNEFQLPAVKPRRFDNSDAGPGVGVTNFEVRFRDAELTLLYRRGYGCRLHSARGCSGDNEAERTVLLVTA